VPGESTVSTALGQSASPERSRFKWDEKASPSLRHYSDGKLEEAEVSESALKTSGLTVGLDVSDRWTSCCYLDEAGEIIEEGRVRTSPDAFTQRFSMLEPCRIVMEVGSHSPWASKLLSDFGHEVIVANPWKVRLIAASITKTDRSDAETLARLGRVDPGLLSPVQHRTQAAHADLAVVHARQALIASRSLLINHVRGAVKPFGARLPACDAYSFHKKAATAIPEALLPALSPLLDLIGRLTEDIRAADTRIEQLSRERYPETRVLRQIQGVGPVIALTYVLTIGDPNRFRSSREVGPYLGLVPRRRESGERSPQLSISKAGDKYLRVLLVNGAHYILGFRGPDTDLRRWGLKHATGGKAAKKKAVIAVARKLAVLLHRLWVTGEVYMPLREEVAAA
jgi:transposase